VRVRVAVAIGSWSVQRPWVMTAARSGMGTGMWAPGGCCYTTTEPLAAAGIDACSSCCCMTTGHCAAALRVTHYGM
jgi:hypothetical protein